MILPDRSATVNDLELYRPDIARIFNTIHFEFGETPAMECTIQGTFPDGLFAAASLDAFFENTTIPPELGTLSLLVEILTPERRAVWVYASKDGVLINVEGGAESWNKGFFERLVESVKSSQRPRVVITKPTWRGMTFGLFLVVVLFCSASGLSSFIRTGNPVVALIGVGGVITISYLAYLSSQWTKEYAALCMRPRPSRVSIAHRPRAGPRPSRSTLPTPTLDVGLRIVGAITAFMAAVVAFYPAF